MVRVPLYPLRFHPILRRYLWGGRRLAELGKPIGDEPCAESWEICDRADDQSVVAEGPLAGATLHELMVERGSEILGRHAPLPRFPLLVKFLDTQLPLSVQVHPDDALAARLSPPDLGKTEAWVVLDVRAGGFLLAGLKRGFDRRAFERELLRGTAELCLARFEPRPGECYFIPAGLVHALGPGLLVAEIQQSSDVTYRLWDWNRTDAEGRPRELHLEAGLEAVDDRLGPASAVTPQPTGDAERQRLVACDKFVIDRLSLAEPRDLSLDNRCHILLTLSGDIELQRQAAPNCSAHPGDVYLLPASLGEVRLAPKPQAVCLDVFLP